MSFKAFKLFFLNVWAIRSILILLVAFLAPLELLSNGTKESRCAYALIAMAILWLTEALPIPVTALLPVVLFPLLGVVPGKVICAKYLSDTSMLFIGGLIVAVAVEEVGLHNRIAMGIITLLGSNPHMLMLGLMLPTWFLSMWISNTAATSMMIPIIQAVMTQIREAESVPDVETSDDYQSGQENKAYDGLDKSDLELKSVGNKYEVNGEVGRGGTKLHEEKEAELTRFAKGLALSVAYGANAGGIATLTGTPPNLILQGQANSLYTKTQEGADSGITFAKWMAFGFPLSLIILVLCWLWLQLFFLRSLCCKRSDKKRQEAIKTAIEKEKEKLGKMTFGEIIVLILFICLALLWIFREIPGFGGWADLFSKHPKDGSYARDSTAAMLIAILLFILPKKIPNVFCWTSDGEKPTYVPILSWETAVHKVPWGIIILLGGGFALAFASKESGLSKLVGCKLTIFSEMDLWVMNLIICLIVAGATEITSNSATATLLMPIMAELAISLGTHPLYLMISTAVACSFAFMLPVATPPNAIVFSTGYIRIPDMASAGITMNVIAILGLTLAINTWGIPIFELDVMPSIFNTTGVNSTNCP